MNTRFDVYAYIPPVFSIALSVYQLLILDGVLSTRVRATIEHEAAEIPMELRHELGILADAISRDRVLQVGYLSGLFSFVASLAATLRTTSAAWTFWALIVVFVAGLLSALSVFLHDPGYLARTRVRPEGWLARYTWEELYAYLLMVLNVLIIVITYFAQTKLPSPLEAP